MEQNTRLLGEAVDHWLAVLAPAWAANRSENRLRAIRAEMLARHYDAAAFSRRTKDWRASNASGSAVIGAELDILRNRAREMARNNEWMAKGLAVIEDDVVGSGFLVTFDHAKDKGVAKAAQDAWAAWADTTQCDPEGLQDFSGLLGQAVRGMAEGGDMLIRRRWRLPEDGLEVPLQLQLLEGDHLDTLREAILSTGARIVQGVEHDLIGRRVAYWILREHPGDNLATTRESARVPASEVLHLFRVERKGAVRGIPWAAPCLWRLRQLKSMEDAKLEHQRMANMVVHVVTMPEGVKEFAPIEDDEIQQPIETIGPGTTQYLRPGELFHQTTPPPPGDDHGDYVRVGLLAVAAALGIPYEALTGDLRNTSFSSGRLGWLQWQRRIDAYRWRLVVPRVCDPAARWFLEALSIKDKRFLGCTASWDPPHREMIDPSTEVSAFEKAVRAGFKTRAEIVRGLGGNPDKVLAAAIADRKAQQAGDVGFTTDPKNDVGQQDPTAGPGRKPGEAANPAG